MKDRFLPGRRGIGALCFLGTLILFSLSACSSNLSRGGGLVADTNVKLTPSLGLPLEKIVFWGAYAGAAYLILDPLAPNWEIEQAPLPENHIHLSLRMKRVQVGGGGEARQVFQRRARELVQYGGFDGFEVREYEEGLESSILGSQRVARGVIRLLGKGANNLEGLEGQGGQESGGTAPPARMTSESATKPRS